MIRTFKIPFCLIACPGKYSWEESISHKRSKCKHLDFLLGFFVSISLPAFSRYWTYLRRRIFLDCSWSSATHCPSWKVWMFYVQLLPRKDGCCSVYIDVWFINCNVTSATRGEGHYWPNVILCQCN